MHSQRIRVGLSKKEDEYAYNRNDAWLSNMGLACGCRQGAWGCREWGLLHHISVHGGCAAVLCGVVEQHGKPLRNSDTTSTTRTTTTTTTTNNNTIFLEGGP
uniref:Uncharacterized protein n=1 Tax=Eutreptiella gymnastica TaxID=73025 RepID=A0A7S4FPU2_9EUGL